MHYPSLSLCTIITSGGMLETNAIPKRDVYLEET